MSRSLMFWSMACAVVVACAPPVAPGTPRPDSQVITADEIRSSELPTAFDVVQKLRPQFLNDRGRNTVANSSSAYPRVYLNGILYGEIGSLREILASQVTEIRYYNAGQAQGKFGSGNLSGALAVVTMGR